MTRTISRLALILSTLTATGCAGGPPPSAVPSPTRTGDTAAALAMQREWWRAFTVADTAFLRAHTAPEHFLTLSSGRNYDRAAMLAQAATHQSGANLRLEWANEGVRMAGTDAVVATGRVAETLGAVTQTYQYLTAMERGPSGWRVAAAQSTREVVFTPRVPAAAAGPLADYAGGYRTPRGATLQVVVRDSALALVEPSGAELRMEPIGPGLFEFDTLSPGNGIVRFSFARDGAGRVTSMTRLAPGQANTFPRIP